MKELRTLFAGWIGGVCLRFGSFSEMLRYWAEKAPDHPALVYDAGGKKTLSFSGLLQRVEKRAKELEQGGKSCLGVLSDGSLACVVEIFAAARAGLQIVMLDASLPDTVLGDLMAYTDVDSLWGDIDLCED